MIINNLKEPFYSTHPRLTCRKKFKQKNTIKIKTVVPAHRRKQHQNIKNPLRFTRIEETHVTKNLYDTRNKKIVVKEYCRSKIRLFPLKRPVNEKNLIHPIRRFVRENKKSETYGFPPEPYYLIHVYQTHQSNETGNFIWKKWAGKQHDRGFDFRSPKLDKKRAWNSKITKPSMQS